MHPPVKRRRLNDDKYINNLSSPSLDSFVYHYDNDEIDNEHGENSLNNSNDDQSTENFISQTSYNVISILLEPLKRKMPLSNYWVKVFIGHHLPHRHLNFIIYFIISCYNIFLLDEKIFNFTLIIRFILHIILLIKYLKVA